MDDTTAIVVFGALIVFVFIVAYLSNRRTKPGMHRPENPPVDPSQQSAAWHEERRRAIQARDVRQRAEDAHKARMGPAAYEEWSRNPHAYDASTPMTDFEEERRLEQAERSKQEVAEKTLRELQNAAHNRRYLAQCAEKGIKPDPLMMR